MLLDGKKAAQVIKNKISEEVKKAGEDITLAIIEVGDDQASLIYLASKQRSCEELGIKTQIFQMPTNINQKEIIRLIESLNNDDKINAIMVQSPLPSHIDEEEVLNAVNPIKDVDGLGIYNQGKLFKKLPCVVPATAQASISLLKTNNIDIAGKNVVIVGRSTIVGKPLAMLFLNENATVTIAHSKTANLKEVTKKADILAVAIGKPKFITADMVKKDAVVIDIGINRVAGKMCGDVDFDSVCNVASYISPVPGGVGPVTTAILLQNVIKCYKEQKMKKN